MAKEDNLSPLERIDFARGERMVRSLVGPDAFESSPDEEWADPSRKLLKSLPDEDLATLCGREPTSRTGLLAASILRERDAWKSPAKWSLLISLGSLAIAALAYCRTL